jgi:citrate lyase subunit beta/citryl-CoA lyase
VAVVNRVFAPSEREVAWAQAVVEAYEDNVARGEGVFALNGKMVDLPVVERARRVLEEVERS